MKVYELCLFLRMEKEHSHESIVSTSLFADIHSCQLMFVGAEMYLPCHPHRSHTYMSRLAVALLPIRACSRSSIVVGPCQRPKASPIPGDISVSLNMYWRGHMAHTASFRSRSRYRCFAMVATPKLLQMMNPQSNHSTTSSNACILRSNKISSLAASALHQ